MAMTLAAAGLGIGSCHAGVADLRLARQVLGFPEDRDWALLLSLGYPAGRWHRSSPRQPAVRRRRPPRPVGGQAPSRAVSCPAVSSRSSACAASR